MLKNTIWSSRIIEISMTQGRKLTQIFISISAKCGLTLGKSSCGEKNVLHLSGNLFENFYSIFSWWGTVHMCCKIWYNYFFILIFRFHLHQQQTTPRDRNSWSQKCFRDRGGNIILRAVTHTNRTKDTASYYGTLLCPNTGSLPPQVPLWLIYSQVSPWLRYGAVVWHSDTHNLLYTKCMQQSERSCLWVYKEEITPQSLLGTAQRVS